MARKKQQQLGISLKWNCFYAFLIPWVIFFQVRSSRLKIFGGKTLRSRRCHQIYASFAARTIDRERESVRERVRERERELRTEENLFLRSKSLVIRKEGFLKHDQCILSYAVSYIKRLSLVALTNKPMLLNVEPLNCAYQYWVMQNEVMVAISKILNVWDLSLSLLIRQACTLPRYLTL